MISSMVNILCTVNAFSCSKLGVPIKTTISATVLEEALNGTVTIRPLPLGRPVNDKVVYHILPSTNNPWIFLVSNIAGDK